jgi:hypothetical protein
MCCGQTNNFHTPNIPLGGVSNLTQCGGVKLDLLKEWLYKLKRVQKLNVWEQIGIEESELIDRINVLEQWIEIKKSDPESCEYFDQLRSFQTMIVKIIKSKMPL